MTFGEKVRAARIERDLSQKELARRTGIAVRTIINYESGARLPKRRESYVALAEVLDVDLHALMDDNAEFVIHASRGRYGRYDESDSGCLLGSKKDQPQVHPEKISHRAGRG